MKTILIIGAGKSSKVLVDFLLKDAPAKNRKVILADVDAKVAEKKLAGHPSGEAASIDIHDKRKLHTLIKQVDIVVSMVPAFLHPLVAKAAVTERKHFFSASYESAEMKELAKEITAHNLFFLNECGLDPGIDHMSAMKLIDAEKAEGNQIVLFKSYCGGLLSSESEADNPWKYKFTWNPRNVVLAGQSTSRFIRNGRYKFIPYHMLFRRTDLISFKEEGDFDGYANRDSLNYRGVYGLEGIPTIIRGTLRRAGFCKSWDVLVQLGLTDDSFEMDLPHDFTMRMFTNAFLPYDPVHRLEEKIQRLLPWVDKEIIEKLAWLGLFDHTPLSLFKGSPAVILQAILEDKWNLSPSDKDMVVMQHQLETVSPSGTKKSITSSMIIKGENHEYTAMAKTVGLPLAAAVDLFLEGEIPLRGLHLPIKEEIYLPVLKLLANNGITFDEEAVILKGQ
ncbi:saccharopine dehydrogenase family protein [Echinicola vietnamensis]|uniref:Saccharopine dehydrogenase-like oxidoreductase n=1 Tax=Echinicola vietnamensis (strain DSM 17526 / LMG 23754 / KMM 6221) TaxID=926556 RepID=L0FW17_ECHVK|nr:saccharopine dehydrogenase C-terminal domain-containing protein [Echinicola vietnamensis]AGA78074.1 saccharopine dehydrogenase-like oxidoreductase [Echinicola vietnamensis DSM 17526]